MSLTVIRPTHKRDIKQKLRHACPKHRINDFEALVKQHKGDENKISMTIREWWEEEPESKDAEWHDVSKKAVKKSGNPNPNRNFQNSSGHRGDRDRGGRDNNRSSGSGRGFYGRGMGGGRGAGAERRPREFGRDRDRGVTRSGANKPMSSTDAVIGSYVETKPKNTQPPDQSSGVPTPITNVAAPKGAWGQNTNSYVGASSTVHDKEPLTSSEVPIRTDVGSVTAHDPTPAGFLDSKPMMPLESILPSAEDGFAPIASSRPSVPTPAPPTGNVWATKGSAHLIQQEIVKQKPPVSRHVAVTGGDRKSSRDHGNNHRNDINKLHQPQSHHEQELISETATLLASVNNDYVSYMKLQRLLQTITIRTLQPFKHPSQLHLMPWTKHWIHFFPLL